MKILVLTVRYPFPPDRGDKIRMFNIIKQLTKKHEVHLISFDLGEIKKTGEDQLAKICKSVKIVKIGSTKYMGALKALFASQPMQVGYFSHPKIKQQIKDIVTDINPDHIFCHFIRLVELVKDFDIPKTLDYQDAYAMNFVRRIKNANILMKPILKLEAKLISRYESSIFSYFDNKLIISSSDRSFIGHPESYKIHVLSNGINSEYFQPMESKKEFDIGFTGNMNYEANVICSKSIVKDILPILKDRNLKLILCGKDTKNRLKKLKSESVTPTGFVEDIRVCYAKTKVFIAPLDLGTGLQNKVLEAMAMGIPCIVSEYVNHSLEAKEGSQILIGRTNKEFAEHINYLLNNPKIAADIGMAGREYVVNKFSWNAIGKQLLDIIE